MLYKCSTIQRFDLVSNAAILTAGVMYMLVATTGYATFGNAVEANVLINLPNTPVTTVARVFTCLLVSFSYPLLCVPGRTSMISLLAMYDPPGFVVTKEVQQFRFYLFTVS